MKLKLYYSVQNGGDGSAYPRLMESKELAEFDQEHMDEGWGESCTGSITLESDTDIKCLDEVQSKEAYFIDKYINAYSSVDEEEKDEFLAKFFPNGLPIFSVETEKVKTSAVHLYNNVFADGKRVARFFKSIGKSGETFEKILNRNGEHNRVRG